MLGGILKKTRSYEDRISHLPDHLITCHILTRITTWDAVRTSVLSTRWRNLWQLVPSLDLDSGRHFWLFSDFVSFVGRFLDLHKDHSLIQKLCLTIHDRYAGKSYLTSWIDVVTRGRIQHLDISFIKDSGFGDIPMSVYTCGTLVHLRLCRLNLVNVEFVSLPCLKILYLKYIHSPSEAILERLISGCPVLEDLTLTDSSSENVKVLQVRSKTLKRIHINEIFHVVIDAPLLQCLKTVFHRTKKDTVINSSFPAKVDISFGGSNDTLDPNRVSRRKAIRDILTDISRVRELAIKLHSWKDIFPRLESGPLLHFSYLSRLTATFCNYDLRMLQTLLKSCPKLESLNLVMNSS
ncbi:hypothetical protein CARUB_v10027685mg [Capsella rubella]|uniref:F-box domain-containing protein n=1 Tax=Capsella rubella TaxID=81985 RepID=R0GN98_9BRAS|nr:hypothetical protein CARUB_v10027685mg [Capsella rubella]